jgi:hypothetical protein
MSKAAYASLHAGLLMRGSAQVLAAPVDPTDMRELDVRKPPKRQSVNKDANKRPLFTPLARRRAELLPPGWISVQTSEIQPSIRPPADEADRSAAEKAAAIAQKADARLRESQTPVFGRRVSAPDTQPLSTPQADAAGGAMAPAEPVVASAAPRLPASLAAIRSQVRGAARKSMTVRLTLESHRALKLAARRTGRSCQDIMSSAIEDCVELLVRTGAPANDQQGG